MDNTDNLIRSFAMSGYVITDEIREIENRFDVELGHLQYFIDDSVEEYYPQFEQKVRAEAANMSRHYELFYCLENAIRALIADTLQEDSGTNWWDSGKVPQEIVSDVNNRIQKEVDSGVTRRSDASLDYTTFGELSVIITKNWDLFEAILSSRRAVEKVMSSLNLLRGPIAHCCPITDDETIRLQLAVRDWFRMFG